MARAPAAGDPIRAIGDALPDFEVDRTPSLREIAARDPMPGTPMEVQPWPGAEAIMVEPGEWEHQGLGDRRTGLPPGCPVQPLGKDGDTCYLLDTLGAIAELEAGSSGKGPISYLFGGRSRYLEWAWPRYGRAPRGGGKAPVLGWEADNARQALVDACSFRGYFAIEDQVRGRGAWRDADGGLIYHAGDAVWIGGRWRPCGVHGPHIYPARTALGRPAGRARPAGAGSSGDYLLELLRTFRWERPELDPMLMLGWVMTAQLGGALDRRPVAFVTGGEGAGKSTLHKLLRGVMLGALQKSSNTTQAGIYQAVKQDSVAIMVDELEAKEDTRTVDKILELARICYSGDKMQRGGQDGRGREFSLFSSFLGSSIAKPATDAQDDSRMAVLMLRERERAGGKLEVSDAQMATIGRDLLRRNFDAWSRWDEILGAYRAMMVELGHNDRACDTFSPLAAGAHVALCDHAPGEPDFAPWRAWLAPRDLEEVAGRERSWERCWWHLVDAQPDVLRQYHHKSLGSALRIFRDRPYEGLEDLERTAANLGLAVIFPKGADRTLEFARLFVPLKSPALVALFAGTPWGGRLGSIGPWGGVLRQMPPEWFYFTTNAKALNKDARGIAIHLAPLLAARGDPEE